MCFSATASFTAGSVLLAIGTVAARRACATQRHRDLPFALIPVLFGIQQLLEGALWLTFPDKAPCLNVALTQSYSLFSQVLWPIYVPVAVLLMEPVPWRRRLLLGVALAGTAAGLFLLYYLLRLRVVAQVSGQHIVYIFPHFHVLAASGLYLLSTCVSPLLSSQRAVWLFGVVATASFIAAYTVYTTWFISVWCFFAAILSGIVLLHFPRHRAATSTTILSKI
jgi:hypothetical protein